MASNQISHRKPTSTSGPTSSGQRPSAQTNDRTAESSGPLKDVVSRATDFYERGEDSLRECVSGREGSAVLMALASGVGIGLLIGLAVGRSHRQTQTWRDRMNIEGFGRRLMERMEGVVPEALAEHFRK